MNGIFNRELALLISQQHRVDVLHLHFGELDHAQPVQNHEGTGFRETIVYLPAKGNRLQRQWRYFRQFFRSVRQIVKESGKPDVVHVQVAWKMGMMAWLLKLRFGFPFVITEHYTGYLPQDGALRGWKRWASVFLLKRAAAVTVVSKSLQKALRSMGAKEPHVISNSIDEVFFSAPIHEKKEGEKFTFIHVSNFDDRQKQTSKVMQEFAQLHRKYPQTALMLLVPRVRLSEFLAENENLKMDGILHVQPNDNRHIYVERMQTADALISFSRYETFGLTVAESICLGIPVIYTACGGPEYFVAPEMGIEVQANDPYSLYLAMEKMVVEYKFNKHEIAVKAREKLNSEKVLKAYNKVYHSVLKK